MSMNNDFSTYDLGLASVLLSLGFALVELDKGNPRKVRFVFLRTEKIDAAIGKYWSNELKINAQTLLNSQKALKNRIYSDTP